MRPPHKNKIRLVVTREKLVEIVKDELLQAFPEMDDFRRWANGIMHEDEVAEANKFFGPDGKFSSEDGATCISSYFVDSDRKRVGGSLKDKNIAGRGKRKNSQGPIRCKGPASTEKKWESIKPHSNGDAARQDSSYIRALVDAEVARAVAEMMKQLQSKKTACTMQDLLKFNDRYSQSLDGELSGKK